MELFDYKLAYEKIASLKAFKCSHCNRIFSTQVCNGLVLGRVPLLMPCSHTICEECIIRMAKSKKVECKICRCEVALENPEKWPNLFPVERYMFGALLNQNASQASSNIKPTFFTDKSFYSGTIPKNKQISEKDVKREMCSQDDCKNAATIMCMNCCGQIYCTPCDKKIHDSIRILKNHVRYPIDVGDLSALSVKCKSHFDVHAEYYCFTCANMWCSKCIIKDHSGHEVISIEDKNNQDLPSFKDVLKKSRYLLSCMETTLKDVNTEIKDAQKNFKPTQTEYEIIKHFSMLHSTLQILEAKILDKFYRSQASKIDALHRLSEELTSNIGILRPLISTGKVLTTNEENLDKLLISELQEMIVSNLNLPCEIFEDTNENVQSQLKFVVDDSIQKLLQEHCKINVQDNYDFKLIPKTNFDDSIHLEDDFETASVSSETTSSSSSSKCVKNSNYKTSTCRTRLTLTGDVPFFHSPNQQTTKSKLINENATVEKGMEFSVKVTHISSPSLFYVQLSHKQKCIEDLTNKYAISAQHAIVPISVEIGKMYIVQYTDENAGLSKWYRGRVENKLVAGLQTLYEVFFIDYGNSLVVSLNKIREIKNVFANDPNFAYQCRLHGILSARGCWDDTILKDMLDFINCQYDLKMFVVNNNKGILDVSLYSHNGSLSEFLIYIGYARKESIEQSHDRYLRSSKDTPISSSIQNFCKNKRFNVSVTNINNPENMYCRLDEYKDIISNLETGMTRKYDKSDTKQFIFNPEIGMFCAALLVINGNNKWRRAKIIEIPCNGTIQVFAIDYGFTEFVDWRCIRKLHSNYRSIDAQAIKIALSDIKPIDSEKWSETAIEFLQNELNNKITSMEVNQKSTNMLSVSLYQCDIDEEICVNALLIEKGLAISTGEKSQQLKFEKKTKVNCYQEMSSSMIMDGKYWIGVTIVYVESPGCFYVAPLKWNDKQDKFTKELMHYYSDESSPEKEWDINSICIIKSNEDHLFYRAIVTDNLTNGKYKVFLKDIVRTEIISTKDMFVLDDQFAIHDFTIKCRLANMIPCGGSENWSQSSKEYFQEIIELYSHLFITKSDEISDKILPVDLVAKWEDNKGPLNAATIHKTHLNALFIEAGLAIPTKSNKNESNLITPEISEIQYSFGNLAAEDIESPIETEEEPLEFLGPKLTKWLSPYRLKESHFKGWPSYVDLDGIIYIQTAKSKAMLSNIRRVHDNYFKRKTFDKNHVWNCGDLCTVQYHLDKSFYRGTVIETTPDGKIIVQLIDFGNIEECTPEELRTEILMIEQPALAIKCALANVYPKTENKKWPINVLDMLHAAIVEKECEIFLENEDYYEDQLPEITVIINNICINSTIMDWDWRKIKKEGIIDQINDETSDDESNIIIKNEIEVNDEDVDVLLEKEVTYTFVQLPNNIDKFNGVVVGFIDFQSALVEPDFIQNLMNDTAEQFQKMLFDINHYAPHLQKVIDPVIGLPCIALYGSDNCWYRAEILNIDRNEIKVLFVDYGNIDIIPIDDVKEIKEEWLEFSVQMLKCKISGIQLGLYKDNLEVMLLMKEEIEGKHVICEIQENQFHLEVILKLESDPETLAYQKLLDDGSVLECH